MLLRLRSAHLHCLHSRLPRRCCVLELHAARLACCSASLAARLPWTPTLFPLLRPRSAPMPERHHPPRPRCQYWWPLLCRSLRCTLCCFQLRLPVFFAVRCQAHLSLLRAVLEPASGLLPTMDHPLPRQTSSHLRLLRLLSTSTPPTRCLPSRL